MKQATKTMANEYYGHIPQDSMMFVKMKTQLIESCASIMDALHIDWQNDPQTTDTLQRMAQMLIHVNRGRFTPQPELKVFPNTKNIDQMYAIGPVSVRSMCSHHFVPIEGEAWLGILPSENGNLMGLSKFSRVTDWIMGRPQIQEEATNQLGDLLFEALQPSGLALVVRARHLCTSWRGAKEPHTLMVTSDMRGTFKQDAKAREEFFNLIKGQGY